MFNLGDNHVGVQAERAMFNWMLLFSLSVQLIKSKSYLGEATFLLAGTLTVTDLSFSKPFNALTTASQALSLVSPPLK